MSKQKKRWLMIAAFLVILGLILFVVAMTMYQWDFGKLSTVEYETNTYVVDKAFSNISIKTETADIFFVPSDDETCKVVCYEQENMKHSAVVGADTLTVEVVDERKWHEHIGIGFENPKVTIYLPEMEYASLLIRENTGDVEIPNVFRFESVDVATSTGTVNNYASVSGAIKLKTSTGAIRVEKVSAASLELSVSTGGITASDVTCDGEIKIKVSTGKTKLTDVECKKLVTDGNTGNIELNNVIVAETLSIESSTGDVKLDGCDAGEIFIVTDTGDVEGSLLTEKVFITQTDTGSIDVPKTITGGRCEISTDTGDIKLSIAP